MFNGNVNSSSLITSLFPKQIEFFYSGMDAKTKISVGSVRCGKSFQLVAEIVRMAICGPQGDLVFMAKTLANVHYNICGAIRSVLGEEYLPECSVKSDQVKFLGRTVRCIGANNIAAVGRIKGWNIAAVFCDEVTEIGYETYCMIQTRLNLDGAQFVGTTNPDSELHWLKKDVIDKGVSSLYIGNFTLDDNPTLSEEYKTHLHQSLRGALLKRYYYGEWATAEGLVYSDFCDNLIGDVLHDAYEECFCGIDFGLNHRTEAVVCAINSKTVPAVWVRKALSLDQAPECRVTVGEVAYRIVQWLAPDFPKTIYIDPSALALKNELARLLPRGLSICNADNDVLNGINFVSTLFYKGEIKIDHRCKQLIKELYTYSWDDKKSLRTGKDEVIKSDDDGVDALRYALYTRLGTSLKPIRKTSDPTSIKIKQPYYKQVMADYNAYVDNNIYM